MYLSTLYSTCSMSELCGVKKSDILDIESKVDFLKTIYSLLDKEDVDDSSILTIIYNTNIKDKDFLKKLKNFGFIKVFEYSGNEDVVKTFMFKI